MFIYKHPNCHFPGLVGLADYHLKEFSAVFFRGLEQFFYRSDSLSDAFPTLEACNTLYMY